MDSPIIKVTGKSLGGFRYWWMKHVFGFNEQQHCARCFVGPYEKQVGREMLLRRDVLLTPSDAPFLYLCGVAISGGWANNFHVAMRRAPGKSILARTYDGLKVEIENVEQVAIPPLPNGWGGLPRSYTTCRNFQFGVAVRDQLPRNPTDQATGLREGPSKAQGRLF